MKTKTTLLAILLSIFSISEANVGVSQLELSLFNDGQFTVWIDGQNYYSVNGHVSIFGLNPGTQHIRIVEQFIGRRGRVQGRNVLYQGTINIPFRSVVHAQLTPGNLLRIREITPLPVTAVGPRRQVVNQRPIVYERRPTVYDRDPRGPYADQRDPRLQGRHGNGGYGPVPPRGGSVHHERAAYGAFLNTMRGASFDRDRLIIARQFTERGGVSSADVAEIMTLFSFESTRLEYAKFAWHHVIDPENYFLVNQSFQFSGSTMELDRYMRRMR